MSEHINLRKVEFEVQGSTYILKQVAGKWELHVEGGPRLQSFAIDGENYRRVAVRIFELVHGYVGTYGDLAPYLHLLSMIAGEVK